MTATKKRATKTTASKSAGFSEEALVFKAGGCLRAMSTKQLERIRVAQTAFEILISRSYGVFVMIRAPRREGIIVPEIMLPREEVAKLTVKQFRAAIAVTDIFGNPVEIVIMNRNGCNADDTMKMCDIMRPKV